jgi:luciferase family oxidoreductase group 1
MLDLAIVGDGASVRDALDATVAVAQRAEARGYERIWYAEHHNMASIASSATSVLIAHVAAHTSTIRLGSGGIMLPNHAPLTIAEQFGTLAELHPGRIDLGLGRAPGTDQQTFRALRRDPSASEAFPRDVLELQAFLGSESRVAGVQATPGSGTFVPLYILGSSLFGAQLAAMLGLPYAFASHFAPHALRDAVAIYREEFKPSAQLDHPYVIAAVNVVVADSDDAANEMLQRVMRARMRRFILPGHELSDDTIDGLLRSGQGRHVVEMMQYTAVGTPPAIKHYLDAFAEEADADELMVVHNAPRARCPRPRRCAPARRGRPRPARSRPWCRRRARP